MGEAERVERMRAAAVEYLGDPVPDTWFYCSFVGEDGFLGGCYVRGVSMGAAWVRTNVLGINPGGEVQIIGPLPMATFEAIVPVDQRERLLSREEVEAQG